MSTKHETTRNFCWLNKIKQVKNLVIKAIEKRIKTYIFKSYLKIILFYCLKINPEIKVHLSIVMSSRFNPNGVLHMFSPGFFLIVDPFIRLKMKYY